MIQLVSQTEKILDGLWRIPSGWQWRKIAEVAKTTSGGTPSRKKPEYFHGNIPWVKSGELEDNWILETEEKVSQEAFEKSNVKILPKGTLLMAMYGATVGKLGILGVDAATNQAVCAILPDNSLDRDFLFYYLKSRRQIFLYQSIGGAQPNISQAFIREIQVPTPSLKLQKIIVARIETLLAEVKDCRSLINKTRQDAERLLSVALNEVFLKLESVTDVVPLSEVATAFNGKAVGEGNSFIRVFKSKHVYPHSLRLDKPSFMKVEQVEKMPKNRFLRHNDVLMANAAEGTLGRVTYVDRCEENWTVDGKIMILRSLDEQNLLVNKWLYYYLWSDRGRQEILSRRTGTAFAENRGQTGISPKSVLEIPVPKPPTKQQRQAVAYLERIQHEVDEILKLLEQDAHSLNMLEQSILERAFRGEL